MSLVNKVGVRSFALFFALSSMLSSCGGNSSSTGGSDSSVDVSSLSDIPELTDIVSSTSASSSQSAFLTSRSAYVTSGTPPVVSEITSDDVDDLFWDGLLTTLSARIDANNFSISNSEMDSFWKGEGACRVAQEVGYSFQNLQQNGASMCYLKNAPGASDGVEIISGDATPENLFTQAASNKIVQVQISGELPGEEEEENREQNIFIKVYGTSTTEGSAGYAVDLWFCQPDGSTPEGYEQIRINESTGSFTQSSAEGSRGNFVNQFTGQLTADTDGNLIFDADAEQSSEMVFTSDDDTFGDFTFKSRVTRTVDDTLEALSWNENTFEDQTFGRKVYTNSAFTGSDVTDFAFSTAGFATEWNNQEFVDRFFGAFEFQDTLYALVNEGDFFDVSSTYDFDDEDFFAGDAPEDDTGLLDNRSNFDCNVTPDHVVTMDMSSTAFRSEVVALCENNFQDMNFCDSEEIMSIRNEIFSSGNFGEPVEE